MAKQTISFLTDEDITYLRRIIRKGKSQKVNPAHKRYKERVQRGPDCYLVKVPVEGLDARDKDTGEIFGTDCDIFKFNDDEDNLENTDETIKIWNPYYVKWYGNEDQEVLLRAWRYKGGQYLCEKPTYHQKVKPTADVEPGEEVECNVIIGSGPGALDVGTIMVTLAWMASGVGLESLVEASAVFRENELKWEFDGAACGNVTP